MPVPAQLWVSVKFKEIPTLVRTKKDGWRVYSVDCGDGRIVTFDLRPRMFMKIEAGAATYERWSGVVSGKMGARHGNGFHIDEADVVAVMENKKPLKVAPSEVAFTSELADGKASESPLLTETPSSTPVAEEAAASVDTASPTAATPATTSKKRKASKAPKEPRGPEVYRVVRGATLEGAASEVAPVAPERNDTEP